MKVIIFFLLCFCFSFVVALTWSVRGEVTTGLGDEWTKMKHGQLKDLRKRMPPSSSSHDNRQNGQNWKNCWWSLVGRSLNLFESHVLKWKRFSFVCFRCTLYRNLFENQNVFRREEGRWCWTMSTTSVNYTCEMPKIQGFYLLLLTMVSGLMIDVI